MQWSLLSTIISVITAIVSVTAAIVTLRNKSDSMEHDLTKGEENTNKRLEAMDKKMGEAVEKLSEALTMIRLLSTEQSLINKVVSGALSSLTDKVATNEAKLNNHEVAISVLQEVIHTSKRLEPKTSES